MSSKPTGGMPRNTVPDRAAKSLETSLALQLQQITDWKDAMDRAIKNHDFVMQAILGQMRDHMSEAYRHTRNARRNEYEE